MTRTVHRVGDRGILVDLPDLETVMNWHAALSASPLPGQIDAVAAARTVLVVTNSPAHAAQAATTLAHFTPQQRRSETPRKITIDCVYDGEDLNDVSAELSISVPELIDWHTSTTFIGAFGGFAPGFTYCVPDAKPLSVQRRSSPRTAVPAGAVALADIYSAVYPRTSPGGWRLIGTTNHQLWDSSASPPAAIAPGDRVRYRAVEALTDAPATGDDRSTSAMRPHRGVGKLIDAGLITLIEDGGRAGFGNLGVSSSGAADAASARAANIAVGNEPGAAVLENIGGLTLSALCDTVVAVSGATAGVHVNGSPRLLATPILLAGGDTFTIEAPAHGLRSYLALRGGIVSSTELGSSSTDILSGLGPNPLRDGDIIHAPARATGSVGRTGINPFSPVSGETVLRCVAGPRQDWFDGGAEALCTPTWCVGGQSNRVGLRLESTKNAEDEQELTRREGVGELPSEGVMPGSVQVPPSGQPVVFLSDHAVTGGYPVIATVITDDLDKAAQLAPGTPVRFELIDPENL